MNREEFLAKVKEFKEQRDKNQDGLLDLVIYFALITIYIRVVLVIHLGTSYRVEGRVSFNMKAYSGTVVGDGKNEGRKRCREVKRKGRREEGRKDVNKGGREAGKKKGRGKGRKKTDEKGMKGKK